ncbi:amino acid transporter [Pimelobacter simplex]|uniref:amino acid transporter n=2 Tax=Nocardioides simplex TaxID=2045 RepID=UPI00214F856D|nr:amino acid transporter [Pimelobacter simplex]UUW91223.1 amino acid transporter [Pimelobacter simplex]UUW95051.1 amino acid transporter [Pimelobacter simplex]
MGGVSTSTAPSASERALGDPEDAAGDTHGRPWWRVMCLTGVDYFSTLGYQPGIAFLAAGLLSPLATVVLVLLTLFGALPVYRRVAQESPHGQGSIAMLERLLPRWRGKVFVLALLGFALTDFIITITLSAADASAHVVENPHVPAFLHGQELWITLGLIALLGGVFLKGFKEAIGVAVALVSVYLTLNVVVIAVSAAHVLENGHVVTDWTRALTVEHGNIALMIAVSLTLFPKLALGMSGFETGVAVMPHVQGAPDDDPVRPAVRIRNTKRLLTTAAVMMSTFLICSSLVTTLLIPPAEFEEGGQANGRALAFLAHRYLGDVFGTAYDVSTILILWFAGASAMAGMLNLIPRYLPRYGMAPEWAGAIRPLVCVLTGTAFLITWIFDADVNAQGGAYATGVLVLMTSASVAVALAARKARQRGWTIAFTVISVVFVYTTLDNIWERPDGVKIGACFIAAIVAVSLLSRTRRSLELRTTDIEYDAKAEAFIRDCARRTLRLVAHDPEHHDVGAYRAKVRKIVEAHGIPDPGDLLFVEVVVEDYSDFESRVVVSGSVAHKEYRVLTVHAATIPNALAAVLLDLRDRTSVRPHMYFEWTEGSPVAQMVRFLLFGAGEVAPLTREVIRRAEPDPRRRPHVHAG